MVSFKKYLIIATIITLFIFFGGFIASLFQVAENIDTNECNQECTIFSLDDNCYITNNDESIICPYSFDCNIENTTVACDIQPLNMIMCPTVECENPIKVLTRDISIGFTVGNFVGIIVLTIVLCLICIF